MRIPFCLFGFEGPCLQNLPYFLFMYGAPNQNWTQSLLNAYKSLECQTHDALNIVISDMIVRPSCFMAERRQILNLSHKYPPKKY